MGPSSVTSTESRETTTEYIPTTTTESKSTTITEKMSTTSNPTEKTTSKSSTTTKPKTTIGTTTQQITTTSAYEPSHHARNAGLIAFFSIAIISTFAVVIYCYYQKKIRPSSPNYMQFQTLN